MTYDAIIVGGRPAGASLAARLGKRGAKVLLVDRSRFPSEPGVPSSPVMYQAGLAILHELGVDADALAKVMEPISAIGFRYGDYFDTVIPVPRMWGIDHAHGVDRSGFDDLLWRHLDRFPSVERREGFSVRDVVRDRDGRVVGIVGRSRNGESDEEFRARCVIGADGRFSLVARKVGAAVIEEETHYLSTAYHATWEGVPPFGRGANFDIHVTGRGLDLLTLPIGRGRMLVNTHERADRVEIGGDAQAYYLATIAKAPAVHARLRDAKQVSKVVGLRSIGNGYRRAGGPGWALVGDAVHYKDPVDGQGMYDALLGARILDASLAAWLVGARSWEGSVAEYERELHAETHDMFVETVARVRKELYSEPPPLIIKTLIRWAMTDPIYQERFVRYIGRAIPAKGWNSPRMLAAAAWRGLRRDLGLARG
jgi:2-polyprenyl-6-methoxyphenol hydroxylase-like FAD-dependent oxidoreductase